MKAQIRGKDISRLNRSIDLGILRAEKFSLSQYNLENGLCKKFKPKNKIKNKL